MERRSHWRYALGAKVSFAWKGPAGLRLAAEGLTRDLSERDLFVLTDIFPPVGTLVKLEVAFPPFRPGSALQIRTKSQIVRIERAKGLDRRAGFAAVIKSFVLRNLNEAASAGREHAATRQPAARLESRG